MDQEYEAKPMSIKNKEQVEKYANELLSKWEDFSALKKRMDVLNSTLKKYMEENDLKNLQVENGSLVLMTQKRNVLNRALIDDIDQYYELTQVKMLFKQPNEKY